MSEDIRWLIVATKPRMENLAAYHLRRQGFRVWWWHQLKQISVGRPEYRKTRAEMTSFLPGYLFARETDSIGKINDTDGVRAVVTGADLDMRLGSMPVMVPGTELASRAAEIGVQEDGYVPARQAPAPEVFREGTKFRWSDLSPFSLLPEPGEFAETTELDGKRQIEAYVNLLGRKTRVTVPVEQVGEIVG